MMIVVFVTGPNKVLFLPIFILNEVVIHILLSKNIVLLSPKISIVIFCSAVLGEFFYYYVIIFTVDMHDKVFFVFFIDFYIIVF